MERSHRVSQLCEALIIGECLIIVAIFWVQAWKWCSVPFDKFFYSFFLCAWINAFICSSAVSHKRVRSDTGIGNIKAWHVILTRQCTEKTNVKVHKLTVFFWSWWTSVKIKSPRPRLLSRLQTRWATVECCIWWGLPALVEFPKIQEYRLIAETHCWGDAYGSWK